MIWSGASHVAGALADAVAEPPQEGLGLVGEAQAQQRRRPRTTRRAPRCSGSPSCARRRPARAARRSARRPGRRSARRSSASASSPSARPSPASGRDSASAASHRASSARSRRRASNSSRGCDRARLPRPPVSRTTPADLALRSSSTVARTPRLLRAGFRPYGVQREGERRPTRKTAPSGVISIVVGVRARSRSAARTPARSRIRPRTTRTTRTIRCRSVALPPGDDRHEVDQLPHAVLAHEAGDQDRACRGSKPA